MKFLITVLFSLLTFSFSESPSELKEIVIQNSKSKLDVHFVFANGNLPKFFQKVNPKTNQWIVGLLNTTHQGKENNLDISEDIPVFNKAEFQITKRKGKQGVREFLEIHFQLGKTEKSPEFKFKKDGEREITFTWVEKFKPQSKWKVFPATSPIAAPQAKAVEEAKSKTLETEPALEEVLGTKSAFEMGAVIDGENQNKKTTFSPIPKPKQVVVLKKGAKIYQRNTVHSKFIRDAEVGEEFEQVDETPVFSGILLNGNTAYIHKEKIKLVAKLTKSDKQKIKEAFHQADQAKLEKEKQKKLAEEKRLAEQRQKEEAEKKKLEEAKRLKEAAELKRIAEEKRKKEEEEKRLAEEKRARAEQLRKQREEEQRQAELVRLEQENQMAIMLAKEQREKELQAQQNNLKNQVIVYSSFGRRDPFIPVIQSKIDEGDFNIDQMQLVGIIWDPKDPLAVLEHRMEPGISITLRSGDKISNGKVTNISHEKVTFEILEFGVFRSYTLKLSQKEK